MGPRYVLADASWHVDADVALVRFQSFSFYRKNWLGNSKSAAESTASMKPYDESPSRAGSA